MKKVIEITKTICLLWQDGLSLKMQYVGIAAALALFFYGGFYTQGVMMDKI